MKPAYFSTPAQKRLTDQRGMTLSELMVSIVLGLFVVLAATTLLLSSKSGYTSVDETTRLQDTGRYAIDIIGRSVRQSQYEQWDKLDAPLVLGPTFSANIAGLDGKTLDTVPVGLGSPVDPPEAAIKSDVLALRFFGSGAGVGGDGTMLNCAGFGVAAPSSAVTADAERGWSIFYVKENASGDPELRCKYLGASAWSSDAIISGVESFQVLYGVDTNGNGLPTRFMRATAVDGLDTAWRSANPAATDFEKKRNTFWKKIVALKVALLLRGTQPARPDATVARFDLFGGKYAAESSSVDAGTTVLEANLPVGLRDRLRRVFSATILIRNRSAGTSS